MYKDGIRTNLCFLISFIFMLYILFVCICCSLTHAADTHRSQTNAAWYSSPRFPRRLITLEAAALLRQYTIYYLLFTIYYLLFTIYILSTIYTMVFADRFVVGRQLANLMKEPNIHIGSFSAISSRPPRHGPSGVPTPSPPRHPSYTQLV